MGELIEDPRQQTVEAVWRALEADARQREGFGRGYLGASQLGKKCARSIWLSFRWAQKPGGTEGRILALFDRGHREEPVQIARLRAAGIKVWSVDPATGKQFSVDLGPHMGGSADGVVLGFLEAPKTPHVIDFKTASLKQFNEAVKLGARAWKPEYYTQLQAYMHGLELERAVLWVVCKDDDRIYMERIEYDREHAEQMIARGQSIVFAPEPPTRISENPSWYECKFCDQYDHCQLGNISKLARNCRTCTEATPMPDGSWHCRLKDTTLSIEAQRAGCDQHLFIPDMMPRGWKAIEVEGRSIRYDTPSGEYLDRGRKDFSDRG